MSEIYKKKNKPLFLHDYDSESKIFIDRITFIVFMIIFLILLLIINLYYIQIVHHNNYNIKSDKNRIKLIPILPARGIIYDRNGIPLAFNRNCYQLELIPNNVQNIHNVVLELSNLLGFTNEDFKKIQKQYKSSQPYNSIILKNNLNEIQISRFAVNKYRFHGIELKAYSQRYYPYGSTLTHVIGYVSKISKKDINYLKYNGNYHNYTRTDNIGKLGIERYYENILHGKLGYKEIEVNSRGKMIRVLYVKPPENGKDIYLTIDINLQIKIKNLLATNRAAIVVTNPINGEILALTSTPSYDPNLFVNGISIKEYNRLLNNPNYPLINRTTQGLYSPASTVKPFMAIAALSENIININSTIFDPGWWQLPNYNKRYRDWKKFGHGKLNVINAIIESADTFFYKLSYELGIDRISYWMYKFGYGKYTGIDLFEENQGIMPTREWKKKYHNVPWYQGDTIPIGIGQGYWISTPIQMAKALMILINNGKIKIPHLLHSIDNTSSIITYKQTDSIKINKGDLHYWNVVKSAMYGAANLPNGTVNKNFINAPYKVAIKSGTAQLFSYNTYENIKIAEHLRDHKLIIGYAPYHKPIVSVTIILENGGSGLSIGDITRNIFDYVLLKHDDYQINE